MMSVTLLFLLLVFCQNTIAEEFTGNEGQRNSEVCDSKCGCDGIYIYDAVGDRCLINFKKVMKRVLVVYDKNVIDVLSQDAMAKSIYIEGEKIFKGIMIAVFLFMTCAAICVVSACIYCCRINYTDRTLNNDVKALARKLNRTYNPKKIGPKPNALPVKTESCNVVVESAGIIVV